MTRTASINEVRLTAQQYVQHAAELQRKRASVSFNTNGEPLGGARYLVVFPSAADAVLFRKKLRNT
jgi:hypothetical protein